ncbi:MAG: ribonuclease P protein component [Bacilli bacterium]|nr:ribonuclease P protein component [Bacilli bacterium]
MKKQNIIKKNTDFQRIIKSIRPFKSKYYIVYFENIQLNNYFFGISVSKKIGNAVVRNKLKRQIKNIIDKNNYQNNFNCIIILRTSILELNYQQKEEELNKILYKLSIIKEKK